MFCFIGVSASRLQEKSVQKEELHKIHFAIEKGLIVFYNMFFWTEILIACFYKCLVQNTGRMLLSHFVSRSQSTTANVI